MTRSDSARAESRRIVALARETFQPKIKVLLKLSKFMTLPEKCTKCGTTDIVALARGNKGLCYGCYLGEWRKKRTERRKAELIEMLGGSCSSCGYDKTMKALEFHHKHSASKVYLISERIRDASDKDWPKVVQAAKTSCILLCATCHRESH